MGITPDTREDHASYIQEWLTVLKEDNRAIFRAASHAQRAADYLNGLQPQMSATKAVEQPNVTDGPGSGGTKQPTPVKRPGRKKDPNPKPVHQ
jgi:hypothetical protein